MKYQILRTTRFKKDFKTCLKRGLDPQELMEVVELLQKGEILPEKYCDHPLQPSKEYSNCRELHIKPDWLLIYKYVDSFLILYLIRTGSHSDLFK